MDLGAGDKLSTSPFFIGGNMKEHCLICGSANNLEMGDVDHAWECWNCNQRWWIDDQARLEYTVYYDVSLLQAEQDLSNRNTDFDDRVVNFAKTSGEI